MIETSTRTSERAVLVQMDQGQPEDNQRLDELRRLAESAGAQVLDCIRAAQRSLDPRFFIGSGKVEEIHAQAITLNATVVLFNHDLTPSQQRNLERVLNLRVVDRTGLILDIFAQRARSFEGKLQVELAQLQRLSTRLVRGWTHLERQKGGIGLRGPGETQLETDRRLIAGRIRMLQQRLERVASQRNQGRRARAKHQVASVSLVGYTNAGKSTLFNQLTAAEVYAADQLFATLDPTLRRFNLPQGSAAVLVDTVGFIQDLPHDLIAAFRATLEETRQASLLLHVIDAAAPGRAAHIRDVETVLQDIGAAEQPRIEVFNKLDQLPEQTPRVERDAAGRPLRVWVSAHTGAGLDLLRQAVAEALDQIPTRQRVRLGPNDGRLRGRLFELAQVLEDQPNEAGGWDMTLLLPQTAFERLVCQEPNLAQRQLVGHITVGEASE